MVIGHCDLFAEHLAHARIEVGRRQAQVRLGFRAGALEHGAGVARDLEHGGVFGQRVDEQEGDALVARVHNSALEQPAAIALAARGLGHRNTELGASAQLRIDRERQVRHGDEVQAPIEDAEDRVAIEVDALGVAADLLVGGGVAEAQVAIGRVEREQVLRDLEAVAVVQRADGHRGGVGTGVARRPGSGLGHRAGQAGSESASLARPGANGKRGERLRAAARWCS